MKKGGGGGLGDRNSQPACEELQPHPGRIEHALQPHNCLAGAALVRLTVTVRAKLEIGLGNRDKS